MRRVLLLTRASPVAMCRNSVARERARAQNAEERVSILGDVLAGICLIMHSTALLEH